MSLFNSYDRDSYLGEVASPRDTQEGVLTPAVQRARVLANLFGDGYASGVLLSPMVASASASDIFTQVPDVASGGVLAAHITQTMTHSIRIKSADGTKYYIMVTNAATNRTGGA